MPSARIIHFATHGILDDNRGLGSGLAFAPEPSPPLPGEINGLLTAEEILDMTLQAELVVLSACDTGRGRITGDGVIGLSRSFISAGVPSIMVSLWSVPVEKIDKNRTTFIRTIMRGRRRLLDDSEAVASLRASGCAILLINASRCPYCQFNDQFLHKFQTAPDGQSPSLASSDVGNYEKASQP